MWFLPDHDPRPTVGYVRVYSTSATGTATTVWTSDAPGTVWINFPAIDVPRPLTDIEKAIAALRAHADRARLRTRLALGELTRIARRRRPRAPVMPLPLSPFARRTCSQSSRWMVLQ